MIYLSIILVIACILLVVYAIFKPTKHEELKVIEIEDIYYIKLGDLFVWIDDADKKGYKKEERGSYDKDKAIAIAETIARRIRDGYSREKVVATIPIDENRPEDSFLQQLREHLELARKYNDVDEIDRIQNSINLRNG